MFGTRGCLRSGWSPFRSFTRCSASAAHRVQRLARWHRRPRRAAPLARRLQSLQRRRRRLRPSLHRRPLSSLPQLPNPHRRPLPSLHRRPHPSRLLAQRPLPSLHRRLQRPLPNPHRRPQRPLPSLHRRPQRPLPNPHRRPQRLHRRLQPPSAVVDAPASSKGSAVGSPVLVVPSLRAGSGATLAR